MLRGPAARLRCGACLASCVVAVGAATFAAWRIRTTVQRWGDLGSLPPKVVFERVFGTPPTPAVSDIVAAGYAPFNGEAWMRFRATDVDAVIAALKRNALRPLVGPDAKFEPNDWREMPSGESVTWARAVGWESLRYTKKREYYTFNPPGYS